MKNYLLLLVLVLLHITLQTDSKKLCNSKRPNFRAHKFSLRRPIVSSKLANKNLRFPNAIPLLFGNYISNYLKKSPFIYHLTHGPSHKFTLKVLSHQPSSISFLILNPHPRAFPVRFDNVKFTIRVKRPKSSKRHFLHISFRGTPKLPTNSHVRRAQNIFARAFVLTMFDNARLVLGLGSCSSTISSVTAVCNNIFHPTHGITFALQTRPWKGSPLSISSDLPNPRQVSNALCKATSKVVAPNKVNILMIIFAQFLDHDIVLTPSKETTSEDASFPVPPGDPAQGKMHFFRSDPLPMSPRSCCTTPYTSKFVSGRQFNKITSFIDASNIYGSEHHRAMALRSFKNGKLIMKKRYGEWILPRNTKQDINYLIENANNRENRELFAAGDIRANENPALTAVHTIFAREHNRVCNILLRKLRQTRNRKQSDEWLYQQARRIVIAEVQSIVYNEFLPALLGNNALGKYKGYNEKADASMDIMFTTAAFRWGHSTIRNVMETRSLTNQKKSHRLQDLFFNPIAFSKYDIESWLLGSMSMSASGIDLEHADAIRDFLFNPNKRGVLDLVALNIQRGRDHGLLPYTAARKAYGLSSNGEGLVDIPPSLRTKLLKVYGSVNKIDAFIGGLAERPKSGSLLGPFFHAVLTRQFRNLRDGDRFYYENIRWGKFMRRLSIVKKIRRHQIRMADIIKKNTKIEERHMPSKTSALKTA